MTNKRNIEFTNIMGYVVLFALCIICSSCSFMHKHAIVETYEFDNNFHWQICEKCEEFLNQAEHNYCVETVKNPTHLEEGIVKYTCTVCGYYFTENIDKLEGHSFDQKISSSKYLKEECTCEHGNIYYFSCKCGAIGTETYEDEIRSDHTIVKTYEFDSNSHWQSCEICNESLNKEKHYYNIETIKDPTHLEEGIVKYTCTVCGYYFTKNIDKLKEHSFDQKISDSEYLKEECTCEHGNIYYYSCKCGAIGTETYEDEIRLEHSFGKFVDDISEFSCSNKTITRTCSSCGATETQVIKNSALKNHIVIDGKCICCNLDVNDINDFELVDLNIINNDVGKHVGLYYSESQGQHFIMVINYNELNIPVVDLDGTITNATKTNTVDIKFSFNYNEKSFQDISATVKVQGSSSSGYPKKNYTLKLDSKIEVNPEWGNQKKYCLKANYVDFSQSRNVVSGKIFGAMSEDLRLNDGYGSLVNGGAIDGFPVVVYSNGEFFGLYTFNIPKDKWLFGMKNSDSKNQAIVMGDSWTNGVAIYEPMASDFSNGWALEFASNEESKIDNDTTWVSESFNRMYYFLTTNDDETIKMHLSEYINIDRCIDTFIFINVICGADNVSKNLLWTTYDAKQWACTPYDMDGTWGMVWNGTFEYDPSTYTLTSGSSNLVWNTLYRLCYDEICTRYYELRKNILSNSSIQNYFQDFFDKIPNICYQCDAKKWSGVPSKDINNMKQIVSWEERHLEIMDANLRIASEPHEHLFNVKNTEDKYLCSNSTETRKSLYYYSCLCGEKALTVFEIDENAFKITVSSDEHVTVYYYETSKYDSEPIEVDSYIYSRDSDTGEYTFTNGQINIKLVFEEGYELDEIKTSDSTKYKNLKGPNDTSQENTYRITKITGNFDINIKSKEIEKTQEENGYKITFITDHSTITVYNTQNYSLEGIIALEGYSRNSESGEKTMNDGQCNFTIVLEENYIIDEIKITGTYKNLKGPSDTGKDNTYRITKIASDLIVTITTKTS